MPVLPAAKRPSKFAAFLALILILPLAAGCSSSSDNDAATAVETSTHAVSAADDADSARLANLWRTRTQSGAASDYQLGPGDVLDISSPDIPDLKDRTERIAPDGTIALPFIGTVKAAGMSETALRDELRKRLDKYVIHPQVDLFVKEYQSRKVAVVGAVAHPGLYDLTSGKDTIFDMISKAGGMKEAAAPCVLLVTDAMDHAADGSAQIPAAQANPQSHEFLPASSGPIPAARAASYVAAGSLGNADPIVIDLRNFERGGSEMYLAMPARPGDVIVVPDSGEVLLQGWVQKPGNYKITPGMTLLSAIAAAGGALFAADTTRIKVLRSDRRGDKKILLADLNKIENRSTQDLELHGGDVVTVPYSTAKLGPYAIYFIISRAYVGASTPLLIAPAVITALRDRFDFVVIDSCPMMLVSDAVPIAAMVDGAVLVINGPQTPRHLALSACTQLRSVGTRVFGAVLNKVDFESPDFYYSHYSYGYRHSSYYNRAPVPPAAN